MPNNRDMTQYLTKGGLQVTRHHTLLENKTISHLVEELNTQRGAFYASSFEFPGRYTRWDIGFINPPLVITATGDAFQIKALNERGQVLLAFIKNTIETCKVACLSKISIDELFGHIELSEHYFPESMRSKQPSIFSLLRFIIDLFFSDKDQHLGLHGAFGYDLVFQFENLQKTLTREIYQRDLVLYIPDEIFILDHRREQAEKFSYDFTWKKRSTENLKRKGAVSAYQTGKPIDPYADHSPKEFCDLVLKAKEAFRCGDLFEVVLSQTFFRTSTKKPSQLFTELKKENPAPYGFLINLGEQEYLVGASPEMYVRAQGPRVETCPISGTIIRGKNAIEDEQKILELLNSEKDRTELTMCTDVDRNDKSRICEPGSVKVLGRRQIEMYSRLIHTVDHVEGTLKPEFDALDAFLAHTWVVTVTGAPKLWAMRFIEAHEKSARSWYGGAVGFLLFNGDMNTGLTLRTIHLDQGIAKVRAGATLLYDSDPEMEEKETRLKASAILNTLESNPETTKKQLDPLRDNTYQDKCILLVDHEDSFVHTLANYFQQTGARVITVRTELIEQELNRQSIDLMVLSPGPGSPKNFNTASTIDLALKRSIPIFGVCLGLQAIAEYYGGTLKLLEHPVHGKPSNIRVKGGQLFQGFPEQFTAARYHSIYVDEASLQAELSVTAHSADGIVMAIEHKTLPVWAVQFHPESILSLEDTVGFRLILNVMHLLRK